MDMGDSISDTYIHTDVVYADLSPGFKVVALEIISVTLSSSDTAAPQQPALPGVSAARDFKNVPVNNPDERNVETHLYER